MAKRAAQYKIRTSTSADVKLILAQRRAMFEDVGFDNKRQLSTMLRAYARWLKPKLRSGEYRGWFAVTPDGEAVAGAGLWIMEWPPVPSDHSSRRGYIANVYTHPSHRRRGLARRLMKDALACCRKHGIKTVVLHASDQGMPLYETLGFERTKEMRKRFKR